MNLNKLSTRHKSTIFVFTIAAIIFLLMAVLTYNGVSRLLFDQSRQTGMSLARTIAQDIDGDEFARIDSEDDPEYTEILNKLNRYYYYANIEYIYTMKLHERKLVFVVDSDKTDPAACLEEYPWIEDMSPAFDGQVCSDTKIFYDDRWGASFSAYAPIFSADESVKGIVCVDISIEDINVSLRRMMQLIGFILVTSTVITIAIYLSMSTRNVYTDLLTELPNYAYAVRKGKSLKAKGLLGNYTAILVNIKGFKYINSQMGYDQGNIILRDLAIYLVGLTSRKEFVTRLNNDNILLLALNSHADKILEKMKQDNPSADVNYINSIPTSIRAVIYKITFDDTIEQVISICTAAMHYARDSKKADDFLYYNKDMYEDTLRTGNILTSFDLALKNKEFEVFYQPKVDTETSMLCGAEALVRWHRDRKYIPPIKFVPILEEEGLITELDFYVWNAVCEDLKKWEEKGYRLVPISSNFSKKHLDKPDFAKRVLDICDENGTRHDLLSVELTESCGYSNLDALKSFTDSMAEAGIKVSMDDFGTGYSSLSLLGDLTMDEIKIDKSFTDRIFDESTNGAKLVGSVVRMINDLNRQVVCEGVETKEQVEFLKKAGCHIVQGYFFDKPLPRAEFQRRLEDPWY